MLLAGVGQVLGAAGGGGARARAAEAPVAAEAGPAPPSAGPPPAPAPLRVRTYNFTATLPGGFHEEELPRAESPAQRVDRERGAGRDALPDTFAGLPTGIVWGPVSPGPQEGGQENGLVAVYAADAGYPAVRAVFAYCRAASLKTSFFQVGDISQLGSLEEVGRLLLPREVQQLGAEVRRTEPQARDTGTVAGVVQTPAKNYYQYQYLAQSGDGERHVTLSAAAAKGQVYVMQVSAPATAWAEVQAAVDASVATFKLI